MMMTAKADERGYLWKMEPRTVPDAFGARWGSLIWIFVFDERRFV